MMHRMNCGLPMSCPADPQTHCPLGGFASHAQSRVGSKPGPGAQAGLVEGGGGGVVMEDGFPPFLEGAEDA